MNKTAIPLKLSMGWRAWLVLLLITATGITCRAQDAPGASDQSNTLIQLVNNPVQDVLATYEQLTGKQVIKDGNLPTKVININVSEPVTKKAAIGLIEASLMLNGYVLVPGPGNSVKVISVSGDRNPRSQGVVVYSDASQLPTGAVIVSYIMKLKYMNATTAAPIFIQHFAPTPPFGSIVAVPNANVLLITESADSVRQMIRLQQYIDVPPQQVYAHFIPMVRANADRVVETLTSLLGTSSDKSSSPSQAAQNAPLPILGGQTGPVDFVADTRTNRVIIICTDSAFEYLRDFVESFDTASDQSPTHEFQLRYVSVADIMPAIASTLQEGQSEQGESTTGTNGTQAVGNPNSSTYGLTDNSATSGGGTTNVIGSVRERVDRVLPITVTVGSSRLIADQRNNTIIALAPPESLDRIQSVIDRLDSPPKQVYLSVVIMSLDVTKQLEIGADMLLHGDNGFIATAVRPNTLSTDAITSILQNITNPSKLIGPGSGLTMFGSFGGALDLLATAIETHAKVKVLGRPTIYTSNNKKAVISVGSEVPVPSNTVSTVNPNQTSSTALTATIDYKDVLLQLEVVPLINNDNQVTLDIATKNDQLGTSYLIAGTQVQAVNTQQIKTSVTVPDRHTIVLGGLISETETKTKSQVPVLGDLPLVGLAFRGTYIKKQRTELLMLIQPQIVQDERALYNTDAREKERANVMHNSGQFISPTLPLPNNPDLPPEQELVPFRNRKTDVPAPPKPQN